MHGDRGRRRHRHEQAAADDRQGRPRHRLREHGRRARRRSPTSTVTPGSCATAAIRSTSWPSKSSFLEVTYLLIYGELPTADQLAEFDQRIRRHTLLHEDLKQFFNGFPRDAHPMPVLSSAVSALSTFYQDSLDPFDEEQVEISTLRLLAKLPTIAAYAYKKSVGQPFLYPDNSLRPGRELPADDLRLPGRALRGRPRPGQGAGHALRPARRPRAELLDVDGAAGRLLARQPVRLGLGRHQRAVRPAARRRQPVGAGDARGDPGATAATSRASSSG